MTALPSSKTPVPMGMTPCLFSQCMAGPTAPYTEQRPGRDLSMCPGLSLSGANRDHQRCQQQGSMVMPGSRYAAAPGLGKDAQENTA